MLQKKTICYLREKKEEIDMVTIEYLDNWEWKKIISFFYRKNIVT